MASGGLVDMSRTKLVIAFVLSIGIAIGIGSDWSRADSQARVLWQKAVEPGPLSPSHASLANNCAACHAPVRGVEPALCIACHADNTALLQRQPTAFHANVQVCTGCHVEHQNTSRMPTKMDHSLLAQLAHRQVKGHEMTARPGIAEIEAMAKLLERVPRSEDRPAERPEQYVETKPLSPLQLPANHPLPRAGEAALSCASCHASKDRHQGRFGGECIQCHSTVEWTVAKFLHPSPSSTECVQCHKEPPSHNMMHFSMMSAPLARQPNAKVNQCFLCHQTTAWNDIKGVGRIKHH
jgi:hypothetical protein